MNTSGPASGGAKPHKGATRSLDEVMNEVGACMQAYAQGPRAARFVTFEDCKKLALVLSSRGIHGRVAIGPDGKFLVTVKSYTAKRPNYHKGVKDDEGLII
jgi:hypothetical protein